MSSFDFSSYLQDHLSTSRGEDHPTATNIPFVVEILTGGLTNHTARITFTSGPVLGIRGFRFENGGIHSAILKHAPPYIAADPSQPMSVDRQLLEKKALQILSGDDSTFPQIQAVVKKYRQTGKQSIQIPKFIWHDVEKNVLWIEDLGPMKTLSQFLLDGDKVTESAHMQELAAVLGRFLSELFQATANPPEPWIAQTTSKDSLSLYDYLAELVLNNSREVGGTPEAEALVLSDRVRRALCSKAEAEDVCLGMVDFWPESILVEPGEFGRCGLIDWEYFGLTNPSSELGMLLAHIHIHLLNPTTSVAAQNSLQLFAKSMFKAYIQSQPEQIVSIGFKRALLESHGRELMTGVSQYGKLNDESKKRVVAAGLRSLNAAEESEYGVHLAGLRPSHMEGDAHVIWEILAVLGFV